MSNEPHQVSPPDQTNAAFLQQAYQNYQNAVPGEGVPANVVDTSFAKVLSQNTSPDFYGYWHGDYGTVSVQTTVSQQMLRYYSYADQYDTGGMITHTAPSTTNRPGGYVWDYSWTYAGGSTPSNPNP